MLENVLREYDEIILINRKKDRQQNSLLLVESVYDHVKKFNNEYIKLTSGNRLFSPATAIIRNPKQIHTAHLNDSEDDILLVYDNDTTIKMVGHKK